MRGARRAAVQAPGTVDLRPQPGTAADAAERDADQLAGSVVSGRDAPGRIPGTPRLAPSGAGPVGLGAGRELSSPVGHIFEHRLGVDLSGVRVHRDPRAQAAAVSIGALALSQGNHIALRGDQPAEGPAETSSLAHELAHVVLGHTGIRRQADPSGAAARVEIRLVPATPWLFTVAGDPLPAAIAMELYGADYSALLHRAEHVMWVSGTVYELVPELLTPDYRARFHESMRTVLARDVDFIEDKVLETWVDADDEDTLMTYVSWWANRKDLRTETGRSYFDAFLGRLKQDAWYRDYGAWKGSSTPFLDKLYDEVENRAGELHTIIAQNSAEFGAYRPAWLALDPLGRPKETGGVEIKINRELVERSADMILAGLDGITWAGDSRIIRDVVVGLPPPEQASVLQEIMSRYDQRKWGIFGKYGEAWEGGMLYWLFEDLTSADRERVAASLRMNHVLSNQTVDALVAGRGWGGRWLPWTTYKAHEATQFWADYAVEHEETAGGRAAQVMGSFSSLWLPETAGTTVIVLVTASASVPKVGLLPQLSVAFPRMAAALAVVGTGVTSFNVTINAQEWLQEKDVWTGRPLSSEEVLQRGLSALSGTLFLGASFAAAAQPSAGAPPPGTGRFAPPRLVYSGPGRSPLPTGMTQTGSAATREVFVVRGSNVVRVVISEPVPAAPSVQLQSVPLEATPAPATLPAPAGFPGAPALAATAAVAGGVSTSVGAAPAPAPAPAPAQPRGRHPGDAIRLTWFKHPIFYPKEIELGGFEYARDVPAQLPLGEPIGVAGQWWPRVGKTMLLIPESRGRAADDFRAVLENRYGFDWDPFQADHVQDVMWQGADAFENLWPMDSHANLSAGPRQNQHQRVTFQDDNGQVRTMTLQQGRDTHVLEGRWFVIVAVQI